jgi:hypothetical protein
LQPTEPTNSTSRLKATFTSAAKLACAGTALIAIVQSHRATFSATRECYRKFKNRAIPKTDGKVGAHATRGKFFHNIDRSGISLPLSQDESTCRKPLKN